MKGWNVKGRRKRTPFCLLLFCSFSSVNWSTGSFDERGWVQRLGGRRLLVLNGMRGERQLGRRRRQQPIHEYCQCCSPASCIHFPYKEPQWCPLAFWLAETAPGDAQSHVGGTDDSVCVCVYGGVSRELAYTPHSQSARAQPAACQWPHKRDDVMLSQ